MRWTFALILSLGITHASVSYDVVSLGGYGGDYAAATGISSDGRSAGSAVTAEGRPVAFGNGSKLGTQAQAADVNSSGVVVGTSLTYRGARATVWSGGIADQVLDTESYGLAINNAGNIAGSRLIHEHMQAFVTSGHRVVDLPVGGLWSAAYDINSNGGATGYLMQSNGAFRAFVYSPGTGARTLGTLGGFGSYGQALNNRGDVVGASTTKSGSLHAFLYDGMMRDLGTLGGFLSAAYDIDDAGRVVGYSYDAQGHSRAFVWISGVMIDLNSLIDSESGWTLESAYGINNAGQIVGGGTYQGRATAFLLDPRQFDSHSAPVQSADIGEPVPEPAWLGVSALGLLLLGSRRLRRQ